MGDLEYTLSTINKIAACVSEIKKLSLDIIKKLDPVTTSIKDPNNNIVLEGIKKYPQHADKLQQEMMVVVSNWKVDAMKVKDEIDKFIKISSQGFSMDFESCPFLTEVWNGDTYDKQELEGLVALKDDLQHQFSNINRQNLFDIAAKNVESK